MRITGTRYSEPPEHKAPYTWYTMSNIPTEATS